MVIFVYSIILALALVVGVFALALLYVSFTSVWAAMSSLPNELNKHAWTSFVREVWFQGIAFLMMPLDHLKPTWGSSSVEGNSELLVTILPGCSDTDSLFFKLQEELRAEGLDYTTIRYKPFFGKLEHLANRVAKGIKKSPQPLHILIAHSMGGLIAERVDDLLIGAGKQVGIIHIATPFQGTQIASLAARPCGIDMLPGSEFTKQLNLSTQTPRICFNSKYDNLIIPFRSAVFPADHTKQTTVNGWRHNGLLQDQELLSAVTRQIATFKQTAQFH